MGALGPVDTCIEAEVRLGRLGCRGGSGRSDVCAGLDEGDDEGFDGVEELSSSVCQSPEEGSTVQRKHLLQSA